MLQEVVNVDSRGNPFGPIYTYNRTTETIYWPAFDGCEAGEGHFIRTVVDMNISVGIWKDVTNPYLKLTEGL